MSDCGGFLLAAERKNILIFKPFSNLERLAKERRFLRTVKGALKIQMKKVLFKITAGLLFAVLALGLYSCTTDGSGGSGGFPAFGDQIQDGFNSDFCGGF